MDQQWVRRCKQEELNLVDSYAGPKAQMILEMKNPKFSLYAGPEKIGPGLATKADRAMQQDCDSLKDVSRVSVRTPHTDMSADDKMSSVSQRMSQASKASKTTT